ncbi:MAG TPA: hypothetical protein VJR05_08830 [Acidimicrobiia bacterium]|nr:hypothetical protein [Acidimicrobiia bacterium]
MSLGALAMGAAFLWRRFRPVPPPVAAAESVAGPSPVATGPSVEDRDGAWTRQPLDLSPSGKLIAAAGVEAGFVGFGSTNDDDGEERAAVWGSRSGTAWEGLAVLERGRASVAVPWQSGLMLLGTLTTMPYTASAWWSGDGYQWQQLTIADDPVLAGVSFEGAAATAETVVAFGRGPRGPGAWFTTEGGSWQPSPLRGAIDLIAAVPGGLVAFGRHLEERRPLLALSADGISWTQLPSDSVFMFEGIAMAAALPFGGGLVAAGTDKMKGAATVWVSDDGFRWHRTPFEPEPGTSIEHLAALNGHLVAVGTDAGRRRTGRPSSLAIWESTDAVNWDRRQSDGLFATAGATTVASNGSRLLICGALAAGHGSPWPEPVPVSWMREVTEMAVPEPALASN